MSESQARALEAALLNTGYFSHTHVEEHKGGGAHLDVRVKESVLDRFA